MTETENKITDLPVVLKDGRNITIPVYRVSGKRAKIYIHYGRLTGYIGDATSIKYGLAALKMLVQRMRNIEKMQFTPVLDWENRTVYFLGRKRKLTNSILYKDSPEYFYLKKNEKFVNAYDRACEKYIEKRVLEEARRGMLELKAGYKIRIGNYRSKHASFRKKDWLFEFDRRLFAFTPEVIDSVVDHELSHTKEMNHSIRFYGVLFTLIDKRRYNSCEKILNEGRFSDVPDKNN